MLKEKSVLSGLFGLAVGDALGVPVGVYEYIIFSRLSEDRIPFYDDRVEYCKDYLQNKVDKKYIGDQLGSKLSQDLEEAHKRLYELEHTEKELDMWKAVKKILQEKGI